ncbi:MAG: alpha-2-macroglobulin family protein, partial [Cyanobacteria bacterium P01_H01_bin.121]
YVFSIYEQFTDLDPISRIELARYMSALPNFQQQADTIAQELSEVTYETGQTANLNLPPRWGWLNQRPVLQAQTLLLFVQREARPELLDRLLKGLLDLRTQGTWQSTYYNAQALNAIAAYAETEPINAQFQATAKLKRDVILDAQLNSKTNPVATATVPVANLPGGQSDLVLSKSGQGNLHYLAAYSYRLQGDQPGRYSGVRVIRKLRPVNDQTVLATQDLAAPKGPVEVKAGQVFDIGLEITTDHPIDHLVINDPLPAGLEPVNENFATSNTAEQADDDSWQLSYQQLYKDRVVAYGEHLDAGVYSLHYLIRSVTPGEFLWPGVQAYLQYAPEEFGRSVSAQLEVQQ